MNPDTLYKGFKDRLSENRYNFEGHISNLIEMGYDAEVFKAIQAEYEREEGALLKHMNTWITLNHNKYSLEEITIKGNKFHVNNKHGRRIMDLFFAVAHWSDEE